MPLFLPAASFGHCTCSPPSLAPLNHLSSQQLQIKLLTIGNSGALLRLHPSPPSPLPNLLSSHPFTVPSPPLFASFLPPGVGKTCLLLRYANNSFSPTFITTIGIDFKIKTITVNEKRIKLQVRGAGWRAWGVGPLPKVCPALQRC